MKKLIVVLVLLSMNFVAFANENFEYHVVQDKYLEWDPYEGNDIDEYIIVLDDGSQWIFNWHIYKKHQLHLNPGDAVIIKQSSNHEYLMVILSMEGIVKVIPFQLSSWDSNCYVSIN